MNPPGDLTSQTQNPQNSGNLTPPEPPQTPPVSSVSGLPANDEALTQAKTFIEGGSGLPVKTILIILLFLIFLGAGVFVIRQFGLKYFQKTTQKDVTLTYWGLWEEENILGNIITDYQTTHPGIKIVYSRQSHRDYRERLQNALARNESPDMFRFHNTWTPMFKGELAAVPSTVYDQVAYEATFYPTVKNDLKSGGNYVGIPLEFDGLGLFINEEIFRAAGKTPPKTWDELRQTALDLTVKDSQGQIQVAGVALGRTENIDHFSDILALMMLQNGVDLSNPSACTKESSTVTATSETCLGADALTYFTVFSEVDHVWDKTLPPSTMAFATSKLAMYFAPSWEAVEIKKTNPNLAFKIVPVPQLPETNINWASYWAEGVAQRSKNQAEAWEFLKYLSSKEVLEKLYQNQSRTRLFGEPYPRIDMAEKLAESQYVGAYLKSAPTAKSWYLTSRTYDNGINDKMIKYFEDAVNAVNSGKTAKEALQATSSGVSQILSQYGLAAPVVR